MGSLELQVWKASLGMAMDLGVVASVQQIKDGAGRFPETPFEQELVIPVSAFDHSKRAIEVPPGTYRIDARLPSGEVMRETREVADAAGPVEVVFRPHHSPHEWLSLQRLAGNVPSQERYEDWLKELGAQIDDSTLRKKLLPGGTIDVDPAALSTAARMLRGLHAGLKSSLNLIAGAANTVSDTIASIDYLAKSTTNNLPDVLSSKTRIRMPRWPHRKHSVPEAPQLPDFRIVECDAEKGGTVWDALASKSAWVAWEAAARRSESCVVQEQHEAAITLWRISQQRGALPVPTSPPRCFAVSRRGEGIDVIPLPMPWPLGADSPAVEVQILREAGASLGGRTTLTVADAEVGGLLLYLNNGRIGEAAAVLAAAEKSGLAERLVAGNGCNPLAACGAAYVGLATLSGSDAPRWREWVSQLHERFAWLPDGAIVQAVYRMKTATTRDDLDAAAESFVAAYHRGLPFYATGVQQLMQGLYTFRETRAEFDELYRKVSAVALRVDPDQTFTVVGVR